MAVSNGLNLRIKHGSTTLSTIDQWTLDATEAQAPAIPSNAGAQIVTGGFVDATCTAQGFQRVPVVYPGDTGNLNAHNGVTEWIAAMVCKALAVTCDIGGSTNLTAAYTFEGNGAITRQASALTADASEPDVWNSLNGSALWTPTGQSEVTLSSVTQWTLNLEVDTFPYQASGQSGVTLRTIGAKRASGSITFLQDALAYLSTAATLLTPGSTGKLKLYLTAGTYFEIWYPRFSGNQHQTSTSANNTVTLPWTWSAYTNVSGTQTVGKILKAKKEAAPEFAWFGSV